MLIGSFSPLVKIFQKEWQPKLMEKPELMFSSEGEGFEMSIYRPIGNYLIKWRQPKEESRRVIIDWLTGGPDGRLSMETDQYGVVQVPLGTEDTGELFAQLDSILGRSEKEAKKLWEEQRKTLKSSMEKAHELSEFRVKRAIQQCYYFLRDQWQKNSEANLGKHRPSISEYLCVYYMRHKHEQEKDAQYEISSKLESWMEETDALDMPGGANFPDRRADSIDPSVVGKSIKG